MIPVIIKMKSGLDGGSRVAHACADRAARADNPCGGFVRASGGRAEEFRVSTQQYGIAPA
jgi:hypothetical protein